MSDNAAPEAAPAAAETTTSIEAAPSTESTTQPQAADAVADAQTAEAAGQEVDWSRTVTVKIDGQERELTLAEMRDGFNTSSAAHKRFKEAAELRKQTEQQAATVSQVLRILQGAENTSDKVHALKAIGVDPAAFAQELRGWRQQEEALSPEERSRRELEARRRELDRREEDWKTQREREAQEAQTTQMREQMLSDWTAELKANGLSGAKGLKMIERMADIGLELHKAGHPADAKTLAKMALEDGRVDVQTALRDMQPADIAQFLGEETMKALSEWNLQQLRQNGAQPPAVAPAQAQNSPAAAKESRSVIFGWGE